MASVANCEKTINYAIDDNDLVAVKHYVEVMKIDINGWYHLVGRPIHFIMPFGGAEYKSSSIFYPKEQIRSWPAMQELPAKQMTNSTTIRSNLRSTPFWTSIRLGIVMEHYLLTLPDARENLSSLSPISMLKHPLFSVTQICQINSYNSNSPFKLSLAL